MKNRFIKTITPRKVSVVVLSALFFIQLKPVVAQVNSESNLVGNTSRVENVGIGLYQSNEMLAESEVIDYAAPNPYVGQIWDYTDPNNPRLTNPPSDKASVSNPTNTVVALGQISPNPTTGWCNLKLDDFELGTMEYEVQNAQGITIFQSNCLYNNGAKIDLGLLASGWYVIKAKQNNIVHTLKITKI